MGSETENNMQTELLKKITPKDCLFAKEGLAKEMKIRNSLTYSECCKTPSLILLSMILCNQMESNMNRRLNPHRKARTRTGKITTSHIQ